MLRKLTISNYRSIRSLYCDFREFNVFFGVNNAGKTNIMNAINLVLGESWPTPNSFEDKDFFGHNIGVPIEISAFLEPPLNHYAGGHSYEIHGVKLKYDGEETEFTCLNEDGSQLCYQSRNNYPIRVSREIKEQAGFMFLDLNRLSAQQIKNSPWTFYGKYLKRIGRNLRPEQKSIFSEKTNEALRELLSDPEISTFVVFVKDSIHSQTGMSTEFSVSPLNPIDSIQGFKPHLHDPLSNLDHEAEDLGAGIQSALSLAIARGYSEVTGRKFIFAVEEPELYLHPHAARVFYRHLKELSKQNVQVIYTTHSKHFVNLSDVAYFKKVSRDGEGTKISSHPTSDMNDLSAFATISKYNPQINEIFFGDKIVIAEGPTDEIACRYVLEEVLGLDLDRSNISLSNSGGGGGLTKVIENIAWLGPKIYAITDLDRNGAEAQARISRLERAIGPESVFVQDPGLERMFSFEGHFDQGNVLREVKSYFDSGNATPEMYERLHRVLRM